MLKHGKVTIHNFKLKNYCLDLKDLHCTDCISAICDFLLADPDGSANLLRSLMISSLNSWMILVY